MTTLSPETPTPSPFAHDPFYSLGVADAYDEYQAGEDAHTIKSRANEMLDAAPDTIPARLYVIGYANTAIGLMNGHLATVDAQSEVAQTWWARKQGREVSTLHQRNRRPRRTETGTP